MFIKIGNTEIDQDKICAKKIVEIKKFSVIVMLENGRDVIEDFETHEEAKENYDKIGE